MALYERLMGIGEDVAKIPVHQFQATVAEFARGKLTGPQAQAVIDSVSGAPLDAGEVAEVSALVATVTGTALQKIARAKEIDDVLLLAEVGAPGYTTTALVKTRLGVI